MKSLFRSLSFRLLLTHLFVSGLVLILVGVSLLVFLVRSPSIQRETYRRLETTAIVMTNRQGRALLNLDPERLQVILDQLELGNGRLLIVDQKGAVLVDSLPDQPPPPINALEDLASTPESRRGEYRDDAGKRWLYVIRPLGKERGLVLVAPRPSMPVLRILRDEFLPPFLRAAAVALGLSLVLSWLVSRWVAAPLHRMSKAARAVASGDLDQRPPVSGPNEVESLALAFRDMVDKVQRSRQVQRDFVANVSHELKTPLTSIQGFAQAILDGTADQPDAQKRAAQVIFDESDRLHRLVEDLLELARIDAGQLDFAREPVDLTALLHLTAEKFNLPASQKGVVLDSLIPPLPPLIGDGDRLAQVFNNLLDNAIKHTPPGGRVSVRGETEAGWITLHIDDTGPGIPTEELSRIFERFYQLDKARSGGKDRGVGLGLAISREIVQAHGGRLVAQSKAGHGSRFTVHLPIVLPSDETLARPMPPTRL